MKLQRMIIAFLLVVSLAMLGTAACTASAPKFDRQGLVDLMQKYITGLVNHNPGDLPFAENVKFTENSDKAIELLEVGKGLWENATGGPTEFQIYAADPVLQSAVCIVGMKEKDKDILLGARIKLEEGKIIEAEQMSREDLLKIGLSYYDALTSEDGTRAPFAKECERSENGMITAGGTPPKPREGAGGAMPVGGFGNTPRDCEGQLSAGVFAYITEIRPHMVVADVQKGISAGFSMFRHDGTKRLPADAEPGTDNKTQWGQFNMAALHIYKIRNGKLYEIEAPGAMLPYGVKSNWEAEEKVFPKPKQ